MTTAYLVGLVIGFVILGGSQALGMWLEARRQDKLRKEMAQEWEAYQDQIAQNWPKDLKVKE